MTKNFFVLVVITNMTKQTLMLRKNIRNIFVKFHFFYKKKKLAHAYFKRRYFSKSFGGKIETF